MIPIDWNPILCNEWKKNLFPIEMLSNRKEHRRCTIKNICEKRALVFANAQWHLTVSSPTCYAFVFTCWSMYSIIYNSLTFLLHGTLVGMSSIYSTQTTIYVFYSQLSSFHCWIVCSLRAKLCSLPTKHYTRYVCLPLYYYINCKFKSTF